MIIEKKTTLLLLLFLLVTKIHSISITSNLEEEKMDYLFKHNITEGELFHDEIPAPYNSQIQIIHPEQDQVTIKNSITIKIKNKYKNDVYIDNELIRKSNTHLYHEKELKTYGKQYVYLTFFLPNQKYLCVRKRILRLYNPIDSNKYSNNRKEFIYFFNTSFLYNPNRTKQLTQKVTRADLAYFISMMNDVAITEEKKTLFEDVPSELWASTYINYVAEDNIMAEYADGLFRPFAPITKMEYKSLG